MFALVIICTNIKWIYYNKLLFKQIYLKSKNDVIMLLKTIISYDIILNSSNLHCTF